MGDAGHAEQVWHRSSVPGPSPAASGRQGRRPLALCVHPRTVSSAYWSPLTGDRVVSTCIDNRLRVWDNATLRLGSAAPPPPILPVRPSRTYVHSPAVARHGAPSGPVWDPKDPAERTVRSTMRGGGGGMLEVLASLTSRRAGGDRALHIRGVRRRCWHPVDVLDVGGGGPAGRNALMPPPCAFC